MEFWMFIVIGGIIVAGAVVIGVVMISENKKALEAEIQTIEDFTVTQKVFGCDGKSGIAFDDAKGAICLVIHEGGLVSKRVLQTSDLLAVELFEDGNSITKTVRSSQVGGALLGGLALGGVGAIIGGLSGKTKTSNKISAVDLRITVNDVSKPLHDVAFINFEVEKTSLVYKQAIQQARHWAGVLDVLIKRADASSNVPLARAAVPVHGSQSIADELKKLAELKDTGILSEAEFQQEKMRLLARA